MKKLIEETTESPLESLMGETVTLFCANYFYTGKLVGVNDIDVLYPCVLLENPSIVYRTGSWTDKTSKNAQKLPNDIYVMLSAVESFGVMK